MTVVILIAAPEGLRGHLTRWLVEISAGVFVGKMSHRLRDRIWPLLEARIGNGQVIMIEPANNEQRWAVRTAGKDRWHPVDYDGLILSARQAR